MRKKCNEGRVNNKGNCSICTDHGICQAETDTPQYYCTKRGRETQSSIDYEIHDTFQR